MASFGARVLEALADSGLAPAALILEVLPGCWARAVTSSCAAWVSCANGASGWRWIFLRPGTGRWPGSSQHPVDLVRIGPDLVAGLGVDAAAETLIKALVRIGTDLGIPVAADGIERPSSVICWRPWAASSGWACSSPGPCRRPACQAFPRSTGRSVGTAWLVSAGRAAGSCRSVTSSRPHLISPAETNARSI